MKKLLTVLSFTALLLASCSKNSDTTGTNNNNNNNNNAGANTMVVTIDGTSYTMTAAGGRATNGGITVISIAAGDASGKGVALTLTNITAPGTYNLGYTVSTTGTVTAAALTYTYTAGSNDNVVYSSPTIPGTSSGTITIQELTATSCKATFSGDLTKLQGTAGSATVKITNGSLNTAIN